MDGDFRIGEWLIQPQLNRIAGSEKTVQVEPKVMEVLLYLARHAGEVLSKERIIQAVWADTFVTDDVLTHAISELRKAFDDDAKNPRIIETISRRGYRLGSEVERVLEPGSQPLAAESAPTRGVKRKLLLGILGAVVLVSVLAFALIHFREASEPDPVMRFSLTPPEGMRVQLFDGPLLSPDGQHVAFTGLAASGQRLLWVHVLESLTPRVLAGTEGASLPFWSPDSRFLGFFAQGKLKRIERTGGPVLTLCEASRGRGGAWNRQGLILFTPTGRDPLYAISEKGGEIRPVTTLDKARGELSHRYPHFLPDGHHGSPLLHPSLWSSTGPPGWSIHERK